MSHAINVNAYMKRTENLESKAKVLQYKFNSTNPVHKSEIEVPLWKYDVITIVFALSMI